MASDRQQFASALRRWRQLGASGRRSATWTEGLTAIVVSSFTDAPTGSAAARRELHSFRAEGQELATRTELAGGRPVLILDATRPQVDCVVQDPEVASVYFVGNGSLSMVWLAECDRYDWLDVSRVSDHLKRGWCHQRQCGGLTRRLNVPLGLFMLDTPNQLVAALDPAFAPPSLDHPVNECMTAVMTGRPMRYETFVLGAGDFGVPRVAAGFDADLGQTLSGRLRLLRDLADGISHDEAAELDRTLVERFGWDPTPWVRINRRLIDVALDSDDPGRAEALTEVAARLDLAHLNAAYLRRLGVGNGSSGGSEGRPAGVVTGG